MNGFDRQVWETLYRDRLVIRPRTQHSKCNQCVKHKVIIRKMHLNVLAKRAQQLEYRKHLCTQYHDRVRYWQSRSLGRMGTMSDFTRTISIILDSIDHGKFPLPKSLCLNAKCFGAYVRPTLNVTAAIVHGVAVVIFIAEPHCQKDSSYTVELVAYMMHVLSRIPSLNLSRCSLRLHGDNSSRELKNNSILRFLATLTSSQRILQGSLETLQSGHSHEDLDQWFSAMSGFITNQDEVHTTEQYCMKLREWMNSGNNRPHEAIKEVVQVDQVRSWKLDPQNEFVFLLSLFLV